jgi:Bacterial Ig-like domain (group 3)/Putative Ig domain
MFRTRYSCGAMPIRSPRSAPARTASRSSWLVLGAAALCCIVTGAQAQLTDIRPDSPLPQATTKHSYLVKFRPVNPFEGLPVHWSVTPDCLDGSGLTFSPDGGVAATAQISGVAAQHGVFICTVTAQDAGDNVVSKVYKLSIVGACKPPQITSAPPSPTVDPGVPYRYVVATTGNPSQIFSALGLPPGLTIDPVTGVISGTTETGGTYPVTVIVAGCGRSAIQNFTLVVGVAPVSVDLATSPNPAVFGQDITVSVRATGGATPPTGSILLCTLVSGQFCAPPAGAPPPGTPSDQIVAFATAPLDPSGNAVFTLHGLSIQDYVVQAFYEGDANHAASASVPVDQFVIKAVVLPPQIARTGDPPARRAAAPIPALSVPVLALLALAMVVAAFLRARRRG